MLKRLTQVTAGLAVILSLAFVYLPASSEDAASALIAAAKSGDTATLGKILRQGVSPNTHDANGISALEWAAGRGHVDAVKALLSARAAVDGAYNPMKYTPLMRAANFGFRAVAAILIAHGANINARAANGYTPLDYALLTNHRDVAAFLKSHGAKRGSATVGLEHPQILCKIGADAGFGGLSWAAYAKIPGLYFCQGVNHDFPPGAGDVVMYTYEVDGNALAARSIFIETAIFSDSLPKEMIDRTLRPLLARIYSAGGKGPMPSALADAIGTLSNVRQDTAFGLVTATYQAGDPGENTNGAKYTIRITLH